MPTHLPQAALEASDVLHSRCPWLHDAAWLAAFQEAIAATVQPGMKVLELGGGTGLLSFLAARCGAEVRCVEGHPALLRMARQFLAQNDGGHRVEVIEADACDYLPPEPVDMVICQMLHVGLLREKQVPVLAAFQQRYTKAYGEPLPRFLPEASVLAVQPVQQSFRFAGYHAPVPLFQLAADEDPNCRELGAPALHVIVDYQQPLPRSLSWEGLVAIQHSGTLNALRFITKNLLCVLVPQQRTIDWWNPYLVQPLEAPCQVEAGELVRVRFCYEAGASLETLAASLEATPVREAEAAPRPWRHAA